MEKYLLIALSSLTQALDQARWGQDTDSILSELEARGELEEVDVVGQE